MGVQREEEGELEGQEKEREWMEGGRGVRREGGREQGRGVRRKGGREEEKEERGGRGGRKKKGGRGEKIDHKNNDETRMTF